jgi:hypothetical protein
MRGAVYLFRASRNLVEEMSHWNEPQALKRGDSFAPDECWALKRGLQHVMRTRNDVACGHIDPNVVEATVCQPMTIHGALIGVMYIEGVSGRFDEAQLDLIRRLTD